jgi:hypothetical protein
MPSLLSFGPWLSSLAWIFSLGVWLCLGQVFEIRQYKTCYHNQQCSRKIVGASPRGAPRHSVTLSVGSRVALSFRAMFVVFAAWKHDHTELPS